MAWRDSMRPARLFGLDARLIWMVVAFLFFIRTITFVMLVVSLGVFIFLERRGLTLPAAIRLLRCTLVGDHRSAIPAVRRRRLHDTGVQ